MNENDAYIFNVETPTDWSFPPGKSWVAGWFISKTGANFRGIRLRIDDRIFSGIFGQPRPDIERRYRGHAGLPHAGFCFQIEPHTGAKLLRLEILDHGNNWVELLAPGHRGSCRHQGPPAPSWTRPRSRTSSPLY